MNDNIVSCGDIMKQVFNSSLNPQMNLPSVWKSVVSNIKSNKFESEDSEKRMPIGERLAGNTRVIDLKNGVLLIETDHSGWIQYLRMYQKFILTGLKMKLPELQIKSLAFRVAGSNAHLSDSYEQGLKKAQEEMNQKLDEHEKQINMKFPEKQKESKELPPELLEKFESIKRSMLTNSEK